jgi:transcriptional regulator of acetoin/glycerol metabolism
MLDSNIISAPDLIFSPLESTVIEEKGPADMNLNSVEKHTILKVIEKHNGNISRAAKELGLTRTALYRRLNKYEI